MADGSETAAVPDTLSVLVVDDVAMNRDIVKAFLRAAGHRVICAVGGAEAVAEAAGKDFSIILMDIRMPVVDGLEATRRIRTLAGLRGAVPILALSAQGSVEQVAACHAAGMQGHLAKPFDPVRLQAAIRVTVAQHRPD